MSWAARRKLIISLIAGAIIVAFLALLSITVFYKMPTCTDGVQNQDEAGADCGGPCRYLCTALEQPPTVLFTKVLDNGEGRTDIVALVENKNATAAAKDVPYRITLYDNHQILLGEISGTLDLPPGVTEPVYVSGVVSGKQKVASAFLDVDASAPRWYSMVFDMRIMPTVLQKVISGTQSAPRVEVVLANTNSIALSNVQVIVLVRDIRKGVIAASETLIQTLPAQGQATAIFTWNVAFTSAPTSIEVVPIIPLP